MKVQLRAEETIHWVFGIIAGGTRPEENQPFKHMTTEALGRSVLAQSMDIDPDMRRNLIARLDVEVERIHFGNPNVFTNWPLGNLVDIYEADTGAYFAIFEWKSNFVPISGHGGSGEEYDLNRARFPIMSQEVQLIPPVWEGLVKRSRFEGIKSGHGWGRSPVATVLKDAGLDKASVEEARFRALDAAGLLDEPTE